MSPIPGPPIGFAHTCRDLIVLDCQQSHRISERLDRQAAKGSHSKREPVLHVQR